MFQEPKECLLKFLGFVGTVRYLFLFKVISDLPLVKTIWFCSISLKSRVTSGRLDTTLMKKEASRRIEPKEVINKPASSFFWEIKFSIEIWPFEPIKVTPSIGYVNFDGW